jgi:hypothetical protein
MVNTTPEITKREMPKRWVLSISQRIRAVEVKGVVKVRRKSQKVVDLAKGEISKFGDWSDERFWSHCIMNSRFTKSRKDQILKFGES